MADSFLRGELLTETNHEIFRHLDACPVCHTDIASRRALRGSLKTAFDRSEELKSSSEFGSQGHSGRAIGFWQPARSRQRRSAITEIVRWSFTSPRSRSRSKRPHNDT